MRGIGSLIRNGRIYHFFFLAAQGLQGLHGFLAAQGLQGLHGFLAAQGLQGLQGFLAAQGLHGFLAPQGLQGLHGFLAVNLLPLSATLPNAGEASKNTVPTLQTIAKMSIIFAHRAFKILFILTSCTKLLAV